MNPHDIRRMDLDGGGAVNERDRDDEPGGPILPEEDAVHTGRDRFGALRSTNDLHGPGDSPHSDGMFSARQLGETITGEQRLFDPFGGILPSAPAYRGRQEGHETVLLEVPAHPFLCRPRVPLRSCERSYTPAYADYACSPRSFCVPGLKRGSLLSAALPIIS